MRICLLSFLVGFSLNYIKGQCPESWIHYGTSCYLFVRARDVFDEADRKCRGMEANLASVFSDGENTFISHYLQAGPASDLGDVWIGLRRTEPGDTCEDCWEANRDYWEWKYGERVSYQNWRKYEPSGESVCGRMEVSGTWADEVCDREFSFVCEMQQWTTFTTSVTMAPTTPPTSVPETTSATSTSSTGVPQTSVTSGKETGSTSTPLPDNDGNDDESFPLYHVIGAVCGGVVVIALVLLVAILLVRRKRKQGNSTDRTPNTSEKDDHTYYNSPSAMALQENGAMTDSKGLGMQVHDTGEMDYDAIREVNMASTSKTRHQSGERNRDIGDGLYTTCDDTGLNSSHVAKSHPKDGVNDHTYDAAIDTSINDGKGDPTYSYATSLPSLSEDRGQVSPPKVTPGPTGMGDQGAQAVYAMPMKKKKNVDPQPEVTLMENNIYDIK